MNSLLFLLPLLLVSLPYSVATTATAPAPQTYSPDLVQSCNDATYPTLCVRTISKYSGPVHTPQELAEAAVSVTIARSRGLAKFLAHASASGQGTTAIADCKEQVSDSLTELDRALSELKNLSKEKFAFQVSNAQTWVSAALSNSNTCLDGFEEVGVAGEAAVLKHRISNVAKITSNALYMINHLRLSH